MVFASLTFLWVFLPLVLAAYFIRSGSTWRDGVLVCASLFFYAWGEPVHVGLMGFTIVAGFCFGRVIQSQLERNRPRAARWAVAVGAGFCVAILVVFKYLGFATDAVNQVLGTQIPRPELTLPVGISFYVFQTISYIVDVYRRSTQAETSLLRYATYITMFSQLIAGPIVRYVTVAGDLAVRTITALDFRLGVQRFITGLGKKVLLANPMGQVADSVFAQAPETLGPGLAWFGVAAYAFQIYFDFSGYSDMAIGLGRMFGFHFLENFNYPYVARSVSDFWRRWHISLSSFFRDYIYIPLGGNRAGPARQVVNVLIVWSLTGLWHGAAWNFVLWGTYFGVILVLEKALLQRVLNGLPAVLAWAYMTVVILGGWVIFRVESAAAIPGWFRALAGGGEGLSAHQLEVLWVAPLLLPALLFATPWPRRLLGRLQAAPRFAWIADVLHLAILGASLGGLISETFNPFIYFRF